MNELKTANELIEQACKELNEALQKSDEEKVASSQEKLIKAEMLLRELNACKSSPNSP